MSLLFLIAAAAQPVAVRLACDVALLGPSGQFTAPSPVQITFTVDGKAVRDIHVVDTGGILFPGGALKIVAARDAMRVETVTVPAERPGVWTGKVEKKMYRVTLAAASGGRAELGIGREPVKSTGHIGLVWSASHQPDGLPKPITGTGGGNCAVASAEDRP